MGGWWRGPGALVLALGLVVLSFTVSAIVPLIRAKEIGQAAEAITDSAVPSIQELLAARTALTMLRSGVARSIAAPEEPAHRRRSREAAREFQRHVSRYLALPTYPGERGNWREILACAEGVIGATAGMLDRLEAGDRAGAHPLAAEELHVQSDCIVAQFDVNEKINTDQIRVFAERMETIRAETRRVAISLTALSVCLAAVLLGLAVRGLLSQQRAERRVTALLRERADELELFAGRVAHDILSPLTSTGLVLQRLSKHADEPVRESARRGLSGLTKARSTVEGLLEFARAGGRPAEGERTDVAGVAREVVAALEPTTASADAALSLETDGTAHLVAAHHGVVTSLLSNLTENALKFLGESDEKRVVVRLTRPGGRVRVEVEDTGPGLPPEVEGRIFEPYFRASNLRVSGLGLGLATVKKLVEAHRGTVGFRSEPGKGACFWFELPPAG